MESTRCYNMAGNAPRAERCDGTRKTETKLSIGFVTSRDNPVCPSSTVDVSEGIPSPRGPHEVHFVTPGDVETLHLQISRKRESLHPGVVSWQWLHSLVYARGLE
jgi:hypothetical protein